MTDSDQNTVIRFCTYCGTELDVGARFCKSCGHEVIKPNHQPTNENEATGQQSTGNPTKRETVYEGYIHKCPRCGEVLESFVSNCPTCGHEIRGAQSASSVSALASKLEQIEAKKMPPFEGKKSIMKTVFGKDFDDKDDAEEAREVFEKQKQQENASLIINYSVPNTKEDILEFVILAASNINTKKSIDDEVAKAWMAKLEQVYKKAEIALKNGDDLQRIKEIYQRTCNPIKLKKFAMIMLTPLLFSFLLFMGVFEDEPGMFVASLVLFAIIVFITVVYIKRLYK